MHNATASNCWCGRLINPAPISSGVTVRHVSRARKFRPQASSTDDNTEEYMPAAPSDQVLLQQNGTEASFETDLPYSTTEVLVAAGYVLAIMHPHTASSLSFQCRGLLWEFLQSYLWSRHPGQDWAQWQGSFGQQSYSEPFDWAEHKLRTPFLIMMP